MFNWANRHLEKLSETLAPPPSTPQHRFIAALTSTKDEAAALSVLNDPVEPLDPYAPLNQRGMSALHVASNHGASSVIRELILRRGIGVESTDAEGMTPLHHAASSSNPATALPTVKLLLEECSANVLAKNYRGQTPYDVASLQGVRGYLLPKQLQKETQACLDNGGAGLVPGMDMGGMTVDVAPPPMGGGGGPPMGGAAGGATPGLDNNDPLAALMMPTSGVLSRRGGMENHSAAPVMTSMQPAATGSAGYLTPSKQTTQHQHQPHVAETPPRVEDALPDGWIEAFDPSSGNAYYYNQITGTSAWERPVNIPKDPAVSTEPVVGAENSGTIVRQESVDSNNATSSAVNNDESATVTEEKPTQEKEAIAINHKESFPSDKDSNAVGNGKNGGDDEGKVESPPTQGSLPDGWIEAVDPSSGSTYYYNGTTGTSSWERPSIKEQPAADDAENSTLVVVKESAESGSAPDALPDGWTEGTDPSSGNVYYYNHATGVTQWERPVVAKDGTVDAAAEDQTPALADDIADVDNVEDEAAGAVETVEEVQGDTDDAVNSALVVENESAESGSAPDALPDGWAEGTDPSSGNVYYYNHATGVTQWERPVVAKDGTVDAAAEDQTPALADDIADEDNVEDEAAAAEPLEEVQGDSGPTSGLASASVGDSSAVFNKPAIKATSTTQQQEDVPQPSSEQPTAQVQQQPPVQQQQPAQLQPQQQQPVQKQQRQAPQQQPPPSSANSAHSNSISSAPSSGRYALRGGHANTASVLKESSFAASGRRLYKPDGFHSSSNDKELQAKYGHVTNEHEMSRKLAVPPPPMSGGVGGEAPMSGGIGGGGPPVSGGFNPYSAAGNPAGGPPSSGGFNPTGYNAGAGRAARYPSYGSGAGGVSSGPGTANAPTYNVAGFSPQPWSGGHQQKQQQVVANGGVAPSTGNNNGVIPPSSYGSHPHQPTSQYSQQWNNQTTAANPPATLSSMAATGPTMMQQQPQLTPVGARPSGTNAVPPLSGATTPIMSSAKDIFSSPPSGGISSTPVAATTNTPSVPSVTDIFSSPPSGGISSTPVAATTTTPSMPSATDIFSSPPSGGISSSTVAATAPVDTPISSAQDVFSSPPSGGIALPSSTPNAQGVISCPRASSEPSICPTPVAAAASSFGKTEVSTVLATTTAVQQQLSINGTASNRIVGGETSISVVPPTAKPATASSSSGTSPLKSFGGLPPPPRISAISATPRNSANSGSKFSGSSFLPPPPMVKTTVKAVPKQQTNSQTDAVTEVEDEAVSEQFADVAL